METSMIDAVESYIADCTDIDILKAMLIQAIEEGNRTQVEGLYYSFIQ